MDGKTLSRHTVTEVQDISKYAPKASREEKKRFSTSTPGTRRH